MTAANPRVSTFVAIPTGPDGRLDRPRLETAVKYGFGIVRWHLDSQSARTADGRPSQSQLRAKVRRRPEALEMRGPAIAVDELRKDFGTVLALDGLSLDVAPGKVMGLLGPNGLLRPVDPACEGRSYCLKRR